MPDPLELTFDKELPGARTVFRPADLAAYEGTAWDVRISLGDAPLEDAFYFTIEDPEAIHLPIKELLEKHALNRERRSTLDIERYPDLPNIQEELIQYLEAHRRKTLDLLIFVNKNPEPGPIAPDATADKYIATCCFEDGSFDYRVLDLVFLICPPSPEDMDVRDLHEKYAEPCLLWMLGHYKGKLDAEGFAAFTRRAPFKGYAGGALSFDDAYRNLTEQLKRLEMSDLLKRKERGFAASSEEDGGPLFWLTPKGEKRIAALKEEARALREKYDRFSSVSAYPPALGVPDGFDARIQMMRADNVKVSQAVFLMTFDSMGELAFESEDWAERFDSGGLYTAVLEALVYETTFSPEILDAIRALGDNADEEADL
jgi:hypothetical protein